MSRYSGRRSRVSFINAYKLSNSNSQNPVNRRKRISIIGVKNVENNENNDKKPKLNIPEKLIIRNISVPALPDSNKIISDIVLFPPINSFINSSLKGQYPYDKDRQPMDYSIIYSDEETKTNIFGIVTGHGENGDKLCEFVGSKIVSMLLSDECWAYNIVGCMKHVFNTLEFSVYEDSHIPLDFSGCCYTVCIIRRKVLYIAHLGDNRCLIASGNSDKTVLQLTVDHIPDNIEEKARILTFGGITEESNYSDKTIERIPRIYLKTIRIPGLAVSRSIGDNIAHTVGVIGTPDKYQQVISDHDRFLILCSSGVWRVLTNDIIREAISESESARVYFLLF